MEPIRQQLLRKFPPPPHVCVPDDQLAYAVYFMLYAINDPEVTVDGWTLFKRLRESDVSLDTVGLMTLLPSGSVPIALSVKTTEDGLVWSAQLSLRDENWLSLSDSKRWNTVYLYANGDCAEPAWRWDRCYNGVVPEADA